MFIEALFNALTATLPGQIFLGWFAGKVLDCLWNASRKLLNL